MIGLVATATLAVKEPDQSTLSSVLARAAERVERYFTRAQSIVCLELVRLQPLTPSWSSDGFGRTVESELHLSWTPGADGAPSTEARVVRQVLRVNGHEPRDTDPNNCTTPEQQSDEPHPLSLLLPGERMDYEFRLAGSARVNGRATMMVDYRLIKAASVESHLVEGRDDCVNFDVDGGMRGRMWIDAETHDVLQLDQSLAGMVEIPLPKRAWLRSNGPAYWTMERWDMSIRFKRVSFTDPDESLILPASISSVQITRGAETPRLRTTTDYLNYRRFLTSGRVIGE